MTLEADFCVFIYCVYLEWMAAKLHQHCWKSAEDWILNIDSKHMKAIECEVKLYRHSEWSHSCACSRFAWSEQVDGKASFFFSIVQLREFNVLCNHDTGCHLVCLTLSNSYIVETNDMTVKNMLSRSTVYFPRNAIDFKRRKEEHIKIISIDLMITQWKKENPISWQTKRTKMCTET